MTSKRDRITNPRNDSDSDSTGESDEDDQRSAISRRTSLKLLGVAAVPVVVHQLSADDDLSGINYGDGEYGTGGYGDETDESTEDEVAVTDNVNAGESPTIHERDGAEDSPPTSRATIHGNWAVLDPNDAFERGLIEVIERANSSSLIDSE